jgi:hypothetical protein
MYNRLPWPQLFYWRAAMQFFTVKNRSELLNVSDYHNVLVIDGGNEDNPIKIDQSHCLDLLVLNNAYVIVRNTGRPVLRIKAQDHATIIACGNINITAKGSVTIYARGNMKIKCHGKCKVFARGEKPEDNPNQYSERKTRKKYLAEKNNSCDVLSVTAFGSCVLRLWGYAIGRARGSVTVMGFDHSRAYLQQDCKYYRCSPTASGYFRDRAKEIGAKGKAAY